MDNDIRWFKLIQVCLLMFLVAIGVSTCQAIEHVGDRLFDIQMEIRGKHP